MGNKKKISVILITIITVIALAAVVYFSKIFVPSTIKPGDFSTSVITKGEVISTIQASGTVESENEVLIPSPSTSTIKDIFEEPGSRVRQGDIILQLNTETVIAEIENIKDQLEVKRNNLEKTRLNAQSTKLDLSYNEEVKKLKITSLKSQLADQQELLEVGGISPARIEQTKQEIVLAEKDLQTLHEKNSIRLKQLDTEEKGLLLQIRMQEKDLEDHIILLEKMSIKAPSSGIILSISGHKGERVSAAQTLVRMSDLSSFKINGAADEQYADKIKTGTKVFVNIDGQPLEGLIGNITPMVENNQIQFNVHLKQNSHPKLIANQKVDVQIITSQKDSVIRIERLPELEKSKHQKFFVVSGNKAVKKDVELGVIGNKYCEIISGLGAGDVVITDGLGSFRHLNEIEIEN